MGLFSNKPKRRNVQAPRNNLASLTNGSSLPPIGQYVPSKDSRFDPNPYNSRGTDDESDDNETRANTIRNSMLASQSLPILKKSSSVHCGGPQDSGYQNSKRNNSNASAAAAAALSRSNSLKSLSKSDSISSSPHIPRLLRSQSMTSGAATQKGFSYGRPKNSVYKAPRTYSLTRIDENYLSRSNSHKHKLNSGSASAQVNPAAKHVPTQIKSRASHGSKSPGRSNPVLGSPYSGSGAFTNSSIINSRSNSILSAGNNRRSASFSSLPPPRPAAARNQSITSLLSNSSLDMADMTIQSTTTKRGNAIVKQTKIVDSQGVTRRVITKTIKKVGNYEVVKFNVINLSNEDKSNSIVDRHNSILYNNERIEELGEMEEWDDNHEDYLVSGDGHPLSPHSNSLLSGSDIDHHFEGFDQNILSDNSPQYHLSSPQSPSQQALCLEPPLNLSSSYTEGLQENSLTQLHNPNNDLNIIKGIEANTTHPYSNFIAESPQKRKLDEDSLETENGASLSIRQSPKGPANGTVKAGDLTNDLNRTLAQADIDTVSKIVDDLADEAEEDKESQYSDAPSHPIVTIKTNASDNKEGQNLSHVNYEESPEEYKTPIFSPSSPSLTPPTPITPKDVSGSRESLKLRSNHEFMKPKSPVLTQRSFDAKDSQHGNLGSATSNRHSILLPSKSEVSDIMSARSGKSSKSKVSFSGVEYIDSNDNLPKPKKLSKSEMYEAALKAAEAKVYGDSRNETISSENKLVESKNPRRSSFERNRENKVLADGKNQAGLGFKQRQKNSLTNGADERMYSLRNQSNNAGERTYSLRNQSNNASEKTYSLRNQPGNTGERTHSLRNNSGTKVGSSPKLHKKPSISDSLRTMSISSFGSKTAFQKLKPGYNNDFAIDRVSSAGSTSGTPRSSFKTKFEGLKKEEASPSQNNFSGFKSHSLKGDRSLGGQHATSLEPRKVKLSRKEKKYLKEKEKLESMNLSEEIKAAQARYNKDRHSLSGQQAKPEKGPAPQVYPSAIQKIDEEDVLGADASYEVRNLPEEATQPSDKVTLPTIDEPDIDGPTKPGEIIEKPPKKKKFFLFNFRF